MDFDVPEFKITKYLLSNPTKSGFFLRFGYSIEEWSWLQDDILKLMAKAPLIFVRETAYGKKYTVQGDIETPSGRTVKLTTVWMVDPSEPAILRFLTAYPQP